MSDTREQMKARTGRLTEREWNIIVELYEAGGTKQKELAKQFGVTPETISRGLAKREAVYGKNAVAAAQRVVESIREDQDIAIRRAKETREEHYKISSYFAKLAASKIQKAEKKELSYAQAEDELRPILNAMKINQAARLERWQILGLDRDDNLIADDMPELLIREMTDDEVLEVRDARERELIEIGAIVKVAQDAELGADGLVMSDESE